ncbi:Outer membrane protein MIP [Thalassocella blandensis]|nr:Outer membrane protein MIP [Thalassocella blandensis]
MKKLILMTVAGVTVLSLVACNKEAEKEAPKELVLDTVEKKVSYIVGYNTAQQVKASGFALDSQAMAAAIDHVNTDAEALLTEEEMRATMMAFQADMMEKRQAEQTKAMEENTQKGQAFLAENAKREGVVTTESGLQYEVITKGEGESPKATDQVSVNYVGTLIDGEVFDKGEGVTFQVNQLIPGWVEALPMMKVGSKWKLFIPSDLAYGAGGAGQIGPNSTLVFEMELLSIVKEDEAAESEE